MNSGIADSSRFNKETRKQDVGSVIHATGDLSLKADNIAIKGSSIGSELGNTILVAENDINITEGRKVTDIEQAYKLESKGVLSSSTREGYKRDQSDQSLASVIEGKQVIIDANNVNIRGSQVISDDLTQIQAKENISITAAEDHSLTASKDVKKKSGLMSSGGIGFSIGMEKDTTIQSGAELTHTVSTVGSLNGNTNIIAGNHYKQTGSTVSSKEADINILAKSVTIEAAKDQSNDQYRNEYEKKGLTLAVNVPVVSAVQGAVSSVQQVGQSKNDRVNAMATANAGFDSYKAGQSLAQLKDAATGADNLAKAANVSATITYGEQKNINERESKGTTASQSQVYAGGKTTIVATGAGDKSDVNIIGSDVLGMKGTTLAADHDINIKAAEQNSSETSKNSSQGWNAGVAVSYGSEGLAFGVTAGGNVGKGKGNGEESSYANSHVGSSESQTNIISGNATNIIGGQVQGKGIQISAKELNVESLQDTATYKSKQQNIEGQVTAGYGFSASGSASKSNINANYASVNEQSGIFAGDDGYQINVKNNTDLKGAIITSTQTAENLGKNSLDTGTLTASDIHNVSEYDAKGIGISGSVSSKSEKPKSGTDSSTQTEQSKSNSGTNITGYNPNSSGVTKSVGFGLDSDKDSSTTHSGINTQNINIRDEQAQQQLTGKTAEQTKKDILTQVTTDTARENSGAIANNFDKEKVQSEINLQVEVTKKFGENAPKAVADFAQQQAQKLRAQGNEAEAQKWDEGGIYRVAMHTAIGALSTGTLEGTLTTGATAAAAPILNSFEANITKALTEKGMKAETAALVANGVGSLTLAGVGATAGLNTASIGTAVNVDANNRQLHPNEVELIKELAKKYAEEKGISLEEAQKLLTRGALYNIDEGWKKSYYDKISEDEIIKFSEAYQYLRVQTKDISVNKLYEQLTASSSKPSQPNNPIESSDPNIAQLPTINVTAMTDSSYRGHITAEEEKKANEYLNTGGKGFTATSEDYKNKDLLLTYGLAGSSNLNDKKYNDNRDFIEKTAAIKPNEIDFISTLRPDQEIGEITGFGKGFINGAKNTLITAWEFGKGFINYVEHPIDNTQKAANTAFEAIKNAPSIVGNMLDSAQIGVEKYQTTVDLYQMQADKGAEAEYKASILGEIIGGGGIGSLGKNAAKQTVKSVDEAAIKAKELLKTTADDMSGKPALATGTVDGNGGAIAMTGKPDSNGGLGKTEVAGGAVAAGSGEKGHTDNASKGKDGSTGSTDSNQKQAKTNESETDSEYSGGAHKETSKPANDGQVPSEAAQVSQGKVTTNEFGINEVKIDSTPRDAQKILNELDQGKLKPAEAAAGAQLESVLGAMKKYEVPSGGIKGKNPDWEITSGPNKGKTVDAMYTTDNLTQKEINGLNKFYEKNMTVVKRAGELPPEIQNIQKHLNKADFVPIDFRVLNEKNQSIFLNYVKTLPESQQSKFIIVR